MSEKHAHLAANVFVLEFEHVARQLALVQLEVGLLEKFANGARAQRFAFVDDAFGNAPVEIVRLID